MKLTRYILVLCLLLSLGGWGCRAKTVDIPQAETTSTPEVVAPVETEPDPDPSAVNTGLPVQDISDIVAAGDSPDRKALLAVAHTATGIPDSEPFYVWQLYLQGSSAVGDLQGSTSGNRLLVAFENDGSGWQAVYQKKFIDAGESELLASCPLVTDELAQRVDFVVPVTADPFYNSIADTLVRAGRAAGVSGMAVYAPTRLPEGFTLAQANNNDGYSASVMYASGSARLEYVIIIASDYGDETPEFGYNNLSFGDLKANMARSFGNSRTSPDIGTGPHLMTSQAGEHYMLGENISPGMVAAVAESMVRVR